LAQAICNHQSPIKNLQSINRAKRELHMSEHIVSVRIYFVIFLVLMVGTALTVWAGFQDFPGKLNVIIALTIASVKATLVILYFMHLRYSARLVWVIFISALFWLALMFALTFSDYWTREWLNPATTVRPAQASPVSLLPPAYNLDTAI